MTDIELTLTDFKKTEDELQKIANEIIAEFSSGSVQLIGKDCNKLYMFSNGD